MYENGLIALNMERFFKPDFMKSKQMLKKRKHSSHSLTSYSEDSSKASTRSTSTDVECKRQIHSKIEKRRRDKMNSYITQLSTMISMHSTSAHKLDKITVLKMAVQYLKSICSSPLQFNLDENLKYSFITDSEFKKLISKVSEGFLFVISCDSARILFISKSESHTLKCRANDLVGRSLYDVIHPHDIEKVKEQISCIDLNPKHQLLALKSSKELNVDMPSEPLGVRTGDRRSFYFRIKTDIGVANKYLADNIAYQTYKNMNVLLNDPILEHTKYTTIQCVGYLKYWNSNNQTKNVSDELEDTTRVTSFIAIGRTVEGNIKQAMYQADKSGTFISKHSTDGKILFVDHCATMIIGYLPQEMLGINIYDYIHPDDVNGVAAIHQSMLQYASSAVFPNNYRLRTKCGIYVTIHSEWKCLQNPWKKEIEYYYCKNIVQCVPENAPPIETIKEAVPPLVENNLFMPAEKTEHSLIMDMDLRSGGCEKKCDNEESMEMILKFLECDTNIID